MSEAKVCELIEEGLVETKCGKRTGAISDWCHTCRMAEVSLWTKPY